MVTDLRFTSPPPCPLRHRVNWFDCRTSTWTPVWQRPTWVNGKTTRGLDSGSANAPMDWNTKVSRNYNKSYERERTIVKSRKRRIKVATSDVLVGESTPKNHGWWVVELGIGGWDDELSKTDTGWGLERGSAGKADTPSFSLYKVL